jgi:phospholipase C
MRVPLTVVSPWNKGGHVASEVFDHTSILRFLETRFGVHEPNISAWRRAVCGDLTSCFDFAAPDTTHFMASLPNTADLSGRAAVLKEIQPPLPDPAVAPVQERGLRRRRATPYRLDARLGAVGAGRALSLINHSAERAAVFHVYDVTKLEDVPARYTVGAGRELAHTLPISGAALDIFVLGPNGFHRRLTGRSDIFSVGLEDSGVLCSLVVENLTSILQSIAMTDQAYGAAPDAIRLAGGETRRIPLNLADSHGWYERQFVAQGQAWRVAGHVENGEASFSDPAAGGPGPLRLASSA